ncbi:sensor histidine kinase [Streptomyces roseolus]|uniref:sensor histidine kinase n=1 Tax=Streptomyces roseolus TaxID=67358 RepID=UPI0037BBD4A1
MRRAPRPGDLAFAVAGLPVALLCGAYALVVLYAGALLSLTVLGLPFVALGLCGARALGAFHRRLAGRLLGAHVERHEPPTRAGGPLAWCRAVLTDPVGWRSLLYLLLRLPLGVLAFAAAVALPLGGGWLAGFPLWVRLLEPGDRPGGWLDVTAVLLGLALLAAVSPTIHAWSGVERRLARTLLGPARSQGRLRQLETARSTLLAENTDRLRRLERDLHDGTQAQLVALAITLSLADDALEPGTPDAAPDVTRLRTLVDRARRQTDDTIADLRSLTRGLHPVALDGGLGEALPGLTATSPVPVTLCLDLGARPDPAIERTVYFCAAELLTNIAKHSAATAVSLELTATADRVRLSVHDDGRGGVDLLDDGADSTGGGPRGQDGGSGLAGLRERLAAVDGALRVVSPPGGPTTVTAELPARL